MTGFLDVRGWSVSLCKSLNYSPHEYIFKSYHPDTRWLASIGLGWLPRNPRNEVLRARIGELQALGNQSIASAYRQIVAHRKTRRDQKRYMSYASRFARHAQQYGLPGAVTVTAPFLRTFEILKNPDLFDSLPWSSQNLSLTEALEIANAGILANRFNEAHAVLDDVAPKIPEWHLPVRSRAVRLQLACQLALGRRVKLLLDEAHQLCTLLPHDRHMLGLVEATRGNLRQIYQD